MPPELNSDAVTPESLVMQVIQENQELVSQFATGDNAALNALEQKVVQLGAGRLNDHELKDTLMRTLGGSGM